MAASADKDSWDQHWQQFSATSEIGPTPRYRRQLVRSLFGFNYPGDSVRFLEIGSGTGEYAKEFCDAYPAAQYLGLELSRVGVETSRKRVPRAQFVQRDLLQSDASDENIAYGASHVLCSEVLEHLDHPEVLLRNSVAYCSPGCLFVITVPGGPMNAFYRHIGHRRHYTPSDLASLLRGCGFGQVQTFGAGFPFYNLFRLLVTLRGPKFISDVSGEPSAAIRVASSVFETLFRLNSRSIGWQTLGIARYTPGDRTNISAA